VRYIDVCSGISAPTMAWKPLGWKALCFAEIEAFPRAVLSHHYPDVPLNGDFTKIEGTEYGPVDLLVGGTPCQSFSVAGLRGGMADDRGNLALEFLKLAYRSRARWVVFENVPGLLSSNGGRDFGSFLGGLAELGYGFAYRVLDAQYAGVPQRRRRVFVVGYLGDWRRAAAVLFERHSLSGNTPPRRQARKVAPTIPSRSTGGGGLGTDFDCDGGLVRTARSVAIRGRDGVPQAELGDEVANAILTPNGGRAGVGVGAILEASTGDISHCLNAGGMGRQDYETETLIAHSLRAEGFDASEDGTGRGTPLVPVATIQERAVSENAAAGPDGAGFRTDGQAYTLEARTVPQAVAFTTEQTPKFSEDGALTLTKQSPTGGGQIQSVMTGPAVRRLTPRECERLQGFPDDFTLVPYRGKPAADGPRYKALGNSMAVPVVRWIGERINAVEAIQTEARAA
jgi:DNA (cytosine-5)-methyltransferase 1